MAEEEHIYAIAARLYGPENQRVFRLLHGPPSGEKKTIRTTTDLSLAEERARAHYSVMGAETVVIDISDLVKENVIGRDRLFG